jgi:MFS family permease
LLLVLIALCVVGSSLSALGSSLQLVIAGRAIQGLSGAITPLCYGIMRQATGRRSPFWIGVLTGVWSFAAAIGYVVAGYCCDMGEWRLIFWFTAGYGVALLLPLLLLVPEYTRPAPPGKLDIFGGLLFLPAVASVLYGVTLGAKAGWSHPTAWGFVFGGATLLAYWVAYESRHSNPLIDVKLLRQPKIAIANICSGLYAMSLLQLPILTMLVLQQPVATGAGLGVTAMSAGLLKLPSNVVSLFAAPLSGHISGRHGARWAILQGGLLGAVAWSFLALFHDKVWHVVLGTIIAAFALTSAQTGVPLVILEEIEMERSSEATGMSAVVRSIFSAVGAQTVTTILATSRVTLPGSKASFASDLAYQLCFGYVALVAALVAAVSLRLFRSAYVVVRAPAPTNSVPRPRSAPPA